MSNTVSQATVSTQSTGSNASWEDRSVGGEIEEANIQRYQKISPCYNETHFEDDLDQDLELPPRAVLTHPDPFVSTPLGHGHPYGQPKRTQRPSYAGRPSSSMLENHPMHSQNRPQSAMDASTYYVNPNNSMTRRMPTPNGPMTTSVKSVFDCELGCFQEEDGTHTQPENKECCPHSSPASQTSEPKDVWSLNGLVVTSPTVIDNVAGSSPADLSSTCHFHDLSFFISIDLFHETRVFLKNYYFLKSAKILTCYSIWRRPLANLIPNIP